jgi:hypothetical protein
MIRGLTTYRRLVCPAANVQMTTRLPRVRLRPSGDGRLREKTLKTSTFVYPNIFYYTLIYSWMSLIVRPSLLARSLSGMRSRTRGLLECGDWSPLSLQAPSPQVPLRRTGTRRSVRTSLVPTKSPVGRTLRATTPSRLTARNLTLYQCFGMKCHFGVTISKRSAPATGTSKTHFLSLFCVRHAWSRRNPKAYQCLRTLGHRTARFSMFINVLDRAPNRPGSSWSRKEPRSLPA